MMIKEAELRRISELHATLDDDDYRRGVRYANDLLGGLKEMESYDQGVTVFGSSRTKPSDHYYKQARLLCQTLAKSGHSVVTGGSGGIMEAANRGAYEAGGKSIGLNIKLPHEQEPNKYLTDEFEFNYFFARKVILVASAKAWVFFPGGFGTLDELGEILTLVQTAKVPPMPIILFGRDFWNDFDSFIKNTVLDKFKAICPKDRRLYTITDDIDIITDMIDSISTRPVGDALSGMLMVD